MTKKEAKSHKAEWSKALAEGRMVRFEYGAWFKIYATVEAAQHAVATATAQSMHAKIVKV